MEIVHGTIVAILGIGSANQLNTFGIVITCYSDEGGKKYCEGYSPYGCFNVCIDNNVIPLGQAELTDPVETHKDARKLIENHIPDVIMNLALEISALKKQLAKQKIEK